MQLEQSFVLPMPAQRTWRAFHDVALLVECMPGAALTGPADPAALPLSLRVKLGPIVAAFAGTGTVQWDDAAQSGSFAGSAVDAKSNSRVRGEARFAVLPEDAGSRVQVQVDYTLTGALAQFGRSGIVRELAAALTRQFAQNLQQRLADAPDDADAPGDADAADTADAAHAPVDAAPATAAHAQAHAPTHTPTPAPAGAHGVPAASQPASPPCATPAAPYRAAPVAAAPLSLTSLLAAALRAWWRRLLGRNDGDPPPPAPRSDPGGPR